MSAPAGAGIDLADDHAQHRFDHFTLIAHTAQSTAVDIDACAEAIARLAGDAALRRRMGDAGRRRAETIYDWRHVIAAYQALWQELATSRSRAAALGERRADQHTVHPDYPDLFALFAGHAGALLDDDMIVGWADADAPYGVRRSRLLQIDLFSDPVTLDGPAIDRLVDSLAEGPRRVGDIAAEIGTADRARLQRSLLRLYKFGILKIGGRR
jgi:starch synthase